MRVFLTGATGFVGRPLTRALVDRGWQVVALVRNPDSAQAHALARLGAHCVSGDVTSRESLRPAMSGAGLVIHNAAWYEIAVRPESRDLMREINVAGTENVLALAKELGIPRSIHVSSVIAFGSSGPRPRDESFERQTPCRSCYEETKTEAHALARRYQEGGLPLVIVCPNAVVGPNDHSAFGYFLRLYLNRMMPPLAWAPERIVTLVHVDDLAQGIALAAEKGQPGETYILAGDAMTQREILASWATRPGALRVRFWLPAALCRALFAPLVPLQRKLGLPAFISPEIVDSTASFNYSAEKARRELGWTHRSARELWSDVIDAELELKARRTRRGPRSRIVPLDSA